MQLAITSLLVATLLGSVLVPAFETRRIMRLLDEITEVIEPARLQSWRLESGVAMEYSVLQGYALSGDSAQLLRYRSTTDEDAHELVALQYLAPRLGAESVEDLAAVQRRITEWQALNRVLFGGTLSPGQFKAAALSQSALRDSIINEIDLLPSRLSAAAATRRAELRAHERQSLFVNAALVCVALASVVAVLVLSQRERRLAAILQHRVDEESALRHMARALSDAVTIDDAMQRIVEGAIATTRQLGAYVEFAPSDRYAICAAALMDGGAPGLMGERMTRAGSLTEEASVRAPSRRLIQVDAIERRLPSDFPATAPCCSRAHRTSARHPGSRLACSCSCVTAARHRSARMCKGGWGSLAISLPRCCGASRSSAPRSWPPSSGRRTRRRFARPRRRSRGRSASTM